MTNNKQELQFKPPPYIRLQLMDLLNRIHTGEDFITLAEELLNILGYSSGRKNPDQLGDPYGFLNEASVQIELKYNKFFLDETKNVKMIFQLTNEEVGKTLTEKNESGIQWGAEGGIAERFMFFAVELKQSNYQPEELVAVAWSINRMYKGIPSVVLFKYKNRLAISLFDRRLNKSDSSRDVLLPRSVKKVILPIPRVAQMDMLQKLSLDSCLKWIGKNGVNYNFDGLLNAWLKALLTEYYSIRQRKDFDDIIRRNQYHFETNLIQKFPADWGWIERQFQYPNKFCCCCPT